MSPRPAAPTATAGERHDELTLVVLTAAQSDLAFEAARVAEVQLARDWRGAAGLDLFAALAHAPAQSEDEPRVLVIRRDGAADLVVRIAGALRVESIPRASALPLPRVLASRAPWIRSVVLTEGRRPILILEPSHLDATPAGPATPAPG